MTLLPILFSCLFGWVLGHVFALCDRANERGRAMNYAVGMIGAATGTLVSQTVPVLYNKFLAISILSACVALVLFRSLRRFGARLGWKISM